jgi:hypothetical protein
MNANQKLLGFCVIATAIANCSFGEMIFTRDGRKLTATAEGSGWRLIDLGGSFEFVTLHDKDQKTAAPTSPYSDFTATIAAEGGVSGAGARSEAFQRSRIEPLAFFANLSAFAQARARNPGGSSSSANAFAIGESIFDIGFRLTSSHEFNYNGYGFVELTKQGMGTVFHAMRDGVNGVVSGVLGPGEYTLYGIASERGDAGANGESYIGGKDFTFQMTFSPVPDNPSTGPLLGLGLLTLHFLRRGQSGTPCRR